MKSKFVFLLLLVLFISASCTSPTTMYDIQPSPYEFETPMAPPPTIRALPSAANITETDIPETCVNLSLTDFNSAEFNGFLLVSNLDSNNHLLDPSTKQFLDLDQDGNQIFAPLLLSPNKKYLLGLPSQGDYFILRTADTVIRTNIPSSIYWVQPRWLDNEHIAFLSTEEPKQDVIILNPLTGKWETTHLDIPNSKIEQYAPGTRIIYYFMDPSLKRVIYNDQNDRLILWNLERQNEMVSQPPSAYSALFLSRHMWSSDGTKIVVPWPEGWARNPLANELFVLDMKGKLEQLTNLNPKYKFANVESPSWSPDGQHIGFWLRIGDGNSDSLELRQWLAVLDTDTLETTVYCLADELRPWQAYTAVWSPNGQQVIVNFGSQLDSTLKPILVDLAHQTQTFLDTQNMLVKDWMAP